MKKLCAVVAFILSSFSGTAQTRPFSHLDVGFSVGSMGGGMDLSAPLCDYARVRMGFTYAPPITFTSAFSVETVDGTPITQVGLDYVSNMIGSITHMQIDDRVNMNMSPTFCQFKFLVDVMPFRNNKHWNFTLGFYAGSPRIGKAVNAIEDAPTLLGITMYDYFYTNSCQMKSMFGDLEIPGVVLPQVQLTPYYIEKGLVGMPLGKFADGDKAVLLPDDDGTVRADLKVNKIRPYIGVGYTTTLSRDKKWSLALDAGAMLWGGSPSVYVNNVYKINVDKIDPSNFSYDIVRLNEDWTEWIIDEPLQHVDMINDLHGIKGKVGTMVDAARKFKFYPNASVTFSYSIF